MNNEFSKHKRADAIKWVVVFIAIILLAVAVSASLTDWFGLNKAEAITLETGTLKEGDVITGFKIQREGEMDANTVFSSLMLSCPSQMNSIMNEGGQIIEAGGGYYDSQTEPDIDFHFMFFTNGEKIIGFAFENDWSDYDGKYMVVAYSAEDFTLSELGNLKKGWQQCSIDDSSTNIKWEAIQGDTIKFARPMCIDGIAGYEGINQMLIPIHKETSAVTNENGNELSTTDINDMPQMMTFSEVAVASANSGISVKIQATITPDNATNKLVDWSLAWESSSNTTSVSQYVTVTPDSDGSNVATVTCLKEFTGNIILTCTTRDGGFSATCMVRYQGIPDKMVLKKNGTVMSTTPSEIYIGGTPYNFDMVMQKTGGSVGPLYNEFEVVSVTCHGSFIAQVDVVNNASTIEQYTTTFDFDSTIFLKGVVESSNRNLSCDRWTSSFVSASISGSTLTISPIDPTKFQSTRDRTGNQIRYYAPNGNTPISVTVVVREKVSGLQTSITLKIGIPVSSISMSSAELIF